MLAPYLTPPAPGRVTGILFPAGTATPAAIVAILTAEDDAQIVDIRLGGRLVFVVYHQPEFPRQIARLGALRVFDAVAAGCHGLGPSSPLVHLPS
jgi:hypothetical protein